MPGNCGNGDLFGFREGLYAVLIALVLGTAGPAFAEEVALFDRTCVRGAGTMDEALSHETSDLDCGNHRYETNAPFVRLHAKVDMVGMPANGSMMLQTDAALLQGMQLRFTYSDGHVSEVAVTPQYVSQNWFADNRFSVAIPEHTAPLDTVDAVVVRPWSSATLTDFRIVDEGTAFKEQFAHALIHVLIAGLLAATLFFDLFFFRLLRARFIVWHACLTFAMLLFVLANTGLIYELLPGLELRWRYFLNLFSVAVAGLMAVVFLLSILEKHVVPRWLQQAAMATAIFPIVVKLFCLIDNETIRQLGHKAMLLSMLPVIVSSSAIMFCAILRRERLRAYLALSWFGVIAVGLVRLSADFGLTRQNTLIDDGLLTSTALLALGTAAAVASRTMSLRTERDQARLQAIQMGKMAMTDPLTGLGNRRSFERLKVFAKGQGLLLLDIDRFKAINDTFGHATGDRVLAFTAQAMRSCFRDAEFDAQAFRIGGEEFAIILCCPDEERLRAAADRLRIRIEQGPNQGREDLPNVTVSIGAIVGHGLTRMEALERADAALYEAKRSGRNAVVLASGLNEQRAGGVDSSMNGESLERPH